MAKPCPGNPVRRGRRIGIFVFDGMITLDAVGPADVFGLANNLWRHEDPGAALQYNVCLVGSRKGPIKTNTGLKITADLSLRDANSPFDTLVIPGAYAPGD